MSGLRLGHKQRRLLFMLWEGGTLSFKDFKDVYGFYESERVLRKIREFEAMGWVKRIYLGETEFELVKGDQFPGAREILRWEHV